MVTTCVGASADRGWVEGRRSPMNRSRYRLVRGQRQDQLQMSVAVVAPGKLGKREDSWKIFFLRRGPDGEPSQDVVAELRCGAKQAEEFGLFRGSDCELLE